jgi:uncharacterized protein YbaR (Trm112 family)
MDLTTCPHCKKPLLIGALVSKSGSAFIYLAGGEYSGAWATEPGWAKMEIDAVYCNSCGESLPDQYLKAIRVLLD